MKIWFLAFVIFSANSALTGRETGAGGGDGFLAEFRRLGERAHQAFFEHQVIELRGSSCSDLLTKPVVDFDHRPFGKAISAAKIEAVESVLYLDGKRVGALNYPDVNKIEFNIKEWSQMDADGKMQLVIHEILGLRYRNVLDDSDYSFSRQLLEVTKRFTVESVALAMARANNAYDYRMRLIPRRTKVIETRPDEDGLGNYIETEVAIQTFENDSPTSIRVYRILEHDMLGVKEARLDHLEGPAGP